MIIFAPDTSGSAYRATNMQRSVWRTGEVGATATHPSESIRNFQMRFYTHASSRRVNLPNYEREHGGYPDPCRRSPSERVRYAAAYRGRAARPGEARYLPPQVAIVDILNVTFITFGFPSIRRGQRMQAETGGRFSPLLRAAGPPSGASPSSRRIVERGRRPGCPMAAGRRRTPERFQYPETPRDSDVVMRGFVMHVVRSSTPCADSGRAS